MIPRVFRLRTFEVQDALFCRLCILQKPFHFRTLRHGSLVHSEGAESSHWTLCFRATEYLTLQTLIRKAFYSICRYPELRDLNSGLLRCSIHHDLSTRRGTKQTITDTYSIYLRLDVSTNLLLHHLHDSSQATKRCLERHDLPHTTRTGCSVLFARMQRAGYSMQISITNGSLAARSYPMELHHPPTFPRGF